MIHAGTYGAVTHYLKAVAAAGTDDGGAVAAKMKEMPVDDFMTKGGVIRADGRLVRDMYLFQVKAPSESHGKSTTTSWSPPSRATRRSAHSPPAAVRW